MTKKLFLGSFALGALAVLWVALGFVGSNLLALTVTLIIAVVYGVGARELQQFRQATDTLTRALGDIPAALSNLGDWLTKLHPSLQNPVRLRIEGERVGLPGPTLTPYLVGLLVMLGMLGTFLGMVVTLNGAAFSLEGTTDLQAIRLALAEPIKGLGLAFGTSVAGVAASAMLGLMSAIARRERLFAAQQLDSQIATSLRAFSLTHQRQETFKALQQQALALPDVAEKMQAMMLQMERMNQQLGEQLSARLLSNQDSFHRDVKTVYTDLAQSVDQSLKASLTHSAQLAGDSIKPVVEAAMTGIAQQASAMHERMISTAQTQLSALSSQLTEHAQASASQTLGEITRLLSASEDLVRTRIATEAQWLQQHGERMDQLTGALRSELAVLRQDEALRGEAAVARLAELQTALTQHLSTLGTALEEPITRLIHTASEAPRAAAEVIGQLRQEISNSVARDNALLDERSRIMATLSTLLDAINHAAAEQRAVIDSLVASSAVALNKAGSEFAEQVDVETTKLADIAAQVTSSAVDVASLSEAFGVAVQTFSDGNEKLIAHLQRIESAMDKSMARSDEQLAYYVAQAREVIDLSIMSQKEIVDELHELRQQPSAASHKPAAQSSPVSLADELS